MMSPRLPLALLIAAASTAACSERQPSAEAAQQRERLAPVPRIDAQRARALVAAGGILVDVRESSELAETGKLQSALHLPLPGIKAQAARLQVPPELDAYRARPVILYCRTGRRSGEAAEILRRLGIADVHNLGGFEEAARGGFPVEPPMAAD